MKCTLEGDVQQHGYWRRMLDPPPAIAYRLLKCGKSMPIAPFDRTLLSIFNVNAYNLYAFFGDAKIGESDSNWAETTELEIDRDLPVAHRK